MTFMVHTVPIHNFFVGGEALTVIAGPCSLESLDLGLEIGQTAKEICDRLGMNYIFKASYDKANRTSIHSYRGPGLEKGLAQLAEIKEKLSVPVLTDIHESWQAEPVAEVADILQIPASSVARQTSRSCRPDPARLYKESPVPGPQDMKQVVRNAEKGNERFVSEAPLCYNQLVVDMRLLFYAESYVLLSLITHSADARKGNVQRRRPAFCPSPYICTIGIDGLLLKPTLIRQGEK